jgi:hypothetical protein
MQRPSFCSAARKLCTALAELLWKQRAQVIRYIYMYMYTHTHTHCLFTKAWKQRSADAVLALQTADCTAEAELPCSSELLRPNNTLYVPMSARFLFYFFYKK